MVDSIWKIQNDRKRFKDIIKGKIKENLGKYISSDEMIGKQGKDFVKIPVPKIYLPRFKFGSDQTGVGQGEGEVGDILKPGDLKEGGEGKDAGNQGSEHTFNHEVSIDELVEIMGEQLELPRIEPKGKQLVNASRYRYSGESDVGPESLRKFKATYKRALKRQISSGVYVPGNVVVPEKRDKRYRIPKQVVEPSTNALIVYMMDVSSSMQDEEKRRILTFSEWNERWIRAHYKNIESRYIIHSTDAQIVDKKDYFLASLSGGTICSSAYQLMSDEILKEFPSDEWNIYAYHFTDGDNWSSDNHEAIGILSQKIVPNVNLFCYGQTHLEGSFIQSILAGFDLAVPGSMSRTRYKINYDKYQDSKVRVVMLDEDEAILPAIENSLKTGR